MTRSEYSEEIAARIDAQVREIMPLLPAGEGRSFRKIARLCLVDLLSENETIEEINSGKLSQNTLICPSNSWLFPLNLVPRSIPGISLTDPERQFHGSCYNGGTPSLPPSTEEAAAWAGLPTERTAR